MYEVMQFMSPAVVSSSPHEVSSPALCFGTEDLFARHGVHVATKQWAQPIRKRGVHNMLPPSTNHSAVGPDILASQCFRLQASLDSACGMVWT